MRKFKLIKEYPDSLKLGQTVTKTKHGNYSVDGLSWWLFPSRIIENFPEYWEEITEGQVITQGGVVVEIITREGIHFKLGDFVEHKSDSRDRGRIKEFYYLGNKMCAKYGDDTNRGDIIFKTGYYYNTLDVIQLVQDEPAVVEQNETENETVYFKEFIYNERVITVCLNVISEYEFHAGVSIKNPLDKYDKQLGRLIAEGRATNPRSREEYESQDKILFNEANLEKFSVEIYKEVVEFINKMFK